MADETSWAVALWLKYCRIEAVVLSSRYAARHTLLMCCCIDSVWSRGTPRFLTEGLNGMRSPPVSALSLPTEIRREVEATGRTSGFSAFGLSLLLSTRLSVQVWISERRDWNWWEEPPLTTGYHQRICDNHTHGHIASQRVAESTIWHVIMALLHTCSSSINAAL